MSDKVYYHTTFQYFPDRWMELKEVQAIAYSDMDDGSAGLDTLAENIRQSLDNVMILSKDGTGGADEYGCSRWEKILGIEPPGTATLDDRRYAIYLKFFDARPYTWNNLDELLNEVLGADNQFIAERDVTKKTITIRLFLESLNQMDSVTEFLDQIVPADMILTIQQYFNRYSEIEKAGNLYSDLEKYTYEQIRTEKSIVGL